MEGLHLPDPGTCPPIGFAHRGARLRRRENTIAAFALALHQGATGLESDAWMTADGEVVLRHDGATGPPWARRPLSGQPRAGLPRRIPTLAQLYAECGTTFELSLDVKDPATFEPILAVAAANGVTGRLWLCHDDLALLARWRATDHQVRLVQSTRRPRLSARGIAAHVEALRQVGVDALNLPHDDWTAEAVAATHAGGLRAFGWGAQRARHIRALIDLGADGVYSDHVKRMMTEVTRLGA